MQLTPSVEIIPVFPNWVFKSTIDLDEHQRASVLKEINQIPKINTTYGFSTTPGKVGNVGNSLMRLVAAKFFNLAATHFQLTPEHQQWIEATDSHYVGVNPLYETNIKVDRLRWYNAAVIMQGNDMSCDIQFNMLDHQLSTVPPGVQPHTSLVKLNELDVVFWPSHLPWNLTRNDSNMQCVAYMSTFVIKNQHLLKGK